MRYNLVLLSVMGILGFSFSFLFPFIAYFYLLWSSSLSWQFVWWYMFFSHVTMAACLVFPICAWRSGIIVFFSSFLPFFLEKKLFPCFGGAFGTGLLLLLSFHLMFRLFFPLAK